MRLIGERLDERSARGRRRRGTALAVGLLVALLSLAPVGAMDRFIPVASAHAILVHSDPAADAILATPPARVRMWFTEGLNALTSRAIVVDTANREVDNRDSDVTGSDAREMVVSLPLLRAGTYVVFWRTQSADDGHVTSGSFIFRIARPDGSVPPVPAQLPSGHVPGAGGTSASTGSTLDGPTLLQTLATWLALVFMTFWVGGMIWETWIMTPADRSDADTHTASQVAARRFARGAVWTLAGVLVADSVMVLGLAAELAGDWSGLYAPPLLGAILFGSRFGLFWWMRQIVAGAALAMAIAQVRGARNALGWRDSEVRAASASHHELVSGGAWWRWLVGALRAAPSACARGWRGRSVWGRAQLALALALLLAFALSGHAAAVSQGKLGYALAVDVLHLAGNAAWLGGLLYIAVVLVPALKTLPDWQRARSLARGLPHFSVLAIVTVVILAATGSLNATVHLTSPLQLLTTPYGITLALKTELFLLMAGISAHHAFRVRPRLTRALAASPQTARDEPEREEEHHTSRDRALSAVSPHAANGEHGATPWTRGPLERGVALGGGGAGVGRTGDERQSPAPGVSDAARRLADALEDWLRREAALGVGILLCVALLAAFAGSLVPSIPAGASPSSPSSPSAPYASAPQTAHGITVSLRVDPAKFGANTFSVTVRDAQGKPISDAGVGIATQNLDMDMGIQTAQLKPTGTPGVYAGESDLTMAGHWQVGVRVLLPSDQQMEVFQFTLTATY